MVSAIKNGSELRIMALDDTTSIPSALYHGGRAIQRKTPGLLMLLFYLGLSGCIAPPALDVSVMSYDKVTTDLLSQQLLLNIARARHHQPIHFTAVSNIAATFDFRFSAGGTPALTGNSGGMIVPTFGGSVAENPTITIVPIEGEEFTKRLLTPIQESMLTMLLQQGADIDLVLRLLAGEFRELQDRGEVVYHNRPTDAGYVRFRQIVSHLSSIQDRNMLFVEPLRFEQRLEYPRSEIKPELLPDLEKEYLVRMNVSRGVYELSKTITGRIIMTNYDPATLSNEEKIRLNTWAETTPSNELSVDIRPGYDGGEYPIQGNFRLRSLANIINFLGKGIAEELEFDVPKDPRTPYISENPSRTLAITESDSSPSGDEISVSYRDHHYALQPEKGYQWNREGFTLLHQLFQMTVTELPRSGIPSLTIAK